MEGPPSDATLLASVAERDIGAFRALYERHAGWLALRHARRCNDRDLVADAVGRVVAGTDASLLLSSKALYRSVNWSK